MALNIFFSFYLALKAWHSRLWSLKKPTLKTQSHLFLNVSLLSHPGTGFLPSRFCWTWYDQPCLNLLHSSARAAPQSLRTYSLMAWNMKKVCFTNQCYDAYHLLQGKNDLMAHTLLLLDVAGQQYFSEIFPSTGRRRFLLPHRFHAVLSLISQEVGISKIPT